ncbi:5-formyltetrahydrofolate cyclo-ligase [Haloplasma contractile]|uniref:5-formyltetrahydrofolate cyclo-ligase n=1 Tax=Haloplasma contractile SSD-17B TaxID=1033810 RepID=F7PWC3_9MOLU|nr:5-formyltetrahydrofolate cyclo-ligase [Haloplasma contractile]ERJ10902.1 5-formyltetrahydrofolate cyclo-ligase protein [Haloplasma contractile SSD-17B]
MDLVERKKMIRQMIMYNRDVIDQQERLSMDQSVFERLTNSKEFNDAESIFIFVSFRSEVDTHRIIQKAIDLGKRVCVPKIEKKSEGMTPYQIQSLDQLEEGYYGVLEPKYGCELCDKETIDLIIMPGLAFDAKGGRVGYGGGFYDHFINSMETSVRKLAIAYDFQVLDKVPMGENDQLVDQIITDQRVIDCK